jgi:hypothetical protein
MRIGRALILMAFAFLIIGPISAEGTEFSLSFLSGYNRGLGFQANGQIAGFAEGFPFVVRFGAGYTMTEPGKALDSRHIFINDASNGTPEKKGWIWDLRLDLLYPILNRIYLSGGVRYSAFTANFRFVGGNEDFNVTTNQWGVGLGFEGFFPMGRRIDLVISPGVDYFFPSRMTGHDTSYSPDGENINPRRNYTYHNADDAVNQPKLMPRLMVGFAYWLGR